MKQKTNSNHMQMYVKSRLLCYTNAWKNNILKHNHREKSKFPFVIYTDKVFVWKK